MITLWPSENCDGVIRQRGFTWWTWGSLIPGQAIGLHSEDLSGTSEADPAKALTAAKGSRGAGRLPSPPPVLPTQLPTPRTISPPSAPTSLWSWASKKQREPAWASTGSHMPPRPPPLLLSLTSSSHMGVHRHTLLNPNTHRLRLLYRGLAIVCLDCQHLTFEFIFWPAAKTTCVWPWTLHFSETPRIPFDLCKKWMCVQQKWVCDFDM